MKARKSLLIMAQSIGVGSCRMLRIRRVGQAKVALQRQWQRQSERERVSGREIWGRTLNYGAHLSTFKTTLMTICRLQFKYANDRQDAEAACLHLLPQASHCSAARTAAPPHHRPAPLSSTRAALALCLRHIVQLWALRSVVEFCVPRLESQLRLQDSTPHILECT